MNACVCCSLIGPCWKCFYFSKSRKIPHISSVHLPWAYLGSLSVSAVFIWNLCFVPLFLFFIAFPLPFCITHNISFHFNCLLPVNFLLIPHVLIPCVPLLLVISPLLAPHLSIIFIIPAEEVQKLQKHLALLRQEYVKMQQKLVETERRCSVLAAQTSLPGSTSQASDSFISRLLAIVADLYQQEQYRWALDVNCHLLLDEVVFNLRGKRNRK